MMNTPNRLTLLRILLVPAFMFFLLWGGCPHNYLIAGLIFGLASLTDLVDGKLARKNNQVTDFGKFMDPIADKLLICGAFAAFLQLGLSNAWMLIIVLAREFLVTSLRLVVVANGGRVVAANMWGKAKTVSQMVAVIAVMLMQELLYLGWLPAGFPALLVGDLLLWVSVALTAVSGAVYLWQNRKFVNVLK